MESKLLRPLSQAVALALAASGAHAAAITVKQAAIKKAESEPTDDDNPEDVSEDEVEDQPEDDKAVPEAVKIAKSPQAKSHPALANAAIASQQTYEQFLANVEASGAQSGKLREAMKGSAPLGHDAPAAQTPAQKLDPKAIYSRRKPGAQK